MARWAAAAAMGTAPPMPQVDDSCTGGGCGVSNGRREAALLARDKAAPARAKDGTEADWERQCLLPHPVDGLAATESKFERLLARLPPVVAGLESDPVDGPRCNGRRFSLNQSSNAPASSLSIPEEGAGARSVDPTSASAAAQCPMAALTVNDGYILTKPSFPHSP